MNSVDIDKVETNLSQPVDRAAVGDDVILSRHGNPLVRITRLEEPKRPVRFGLLKGRTRIAADFDAPLPADVLKAFQGR